MHFRFILTTKIWKHFGSSIYESRIQIIVKWKVSVKYVMHQTLINEDILCFFKLDKNISHCIWMQTHSLNPGYWNGLKSKMQKSIKLIYMRHILQASYKIKNKHVFLKTFTTRLINSIKVKFKFHLFIIY